MILILNKNIIVKNQKIKMSNINNKNQFNKKKNIKMNLKIKDKIKRINIYMDKIYIQIQLIEKY